MNLRRATTGFFAVLLMANFMHCATHAASAICWFAEYRNCIVTNNATPLNLPPPVCDHEFGCICRGAVVAQVVDAEMHRPILNVLDIVADARIIAVDDALQRYPLAYVQRDFLSDAHSLTALEVRARLASFLI